jgi:hypothetical protein
MFCVGMCSVFLLRRLHDVIGQAIIIWSKKLNYVIDKNYKKQTGGEEGSGMF